MKDARQGLHSLVENPHQLLDAADLLELNEHSPAQVRIARLGDTPQTLFAARTVLTRHQAQPGAKLAATGKVMAFSHRRHNRAGGGRAYARELHQLACPLILFGRLFNMLVVLLDAFVKAA